MKQLKTFIAYDDKGNKLQAYLLYHYNFEEIKKYMTLEIYEKVAYIQEFRYDDKTTKNEDGTFKDLREWKKDDKTIKHFINKKVV